MIIPKKIHFCGVDYTIEEVEALDGNDSWGRTMLGEAKIFIEKDLEASKKQETLIHELLHIAYRHTARGQVSDEQEENIIKPWSHNIYGILKDNGFLK